MTELETHREAVRRLIAWHQAMGVDCVLDHAATDWLHSGARVPGIDVARAIIGVGQAGQAPSVPAVRPSPAPPPVRPRSDTIPSSPPRPMAPPPRTFPTASPDVAQASARDGAVAAASLAALADALARFDGCALKATATNTCFYRGAAQARLMLIGEAPGRDEDLEGRPFVGRAGLLLDKMLAAAGIAEDQVHITNIVYWRPPGNRTPTPQEALVCRPFLERQIELVAPDAIMALGGSAAKHLLGVEDGIMRLRGKWREVELGGRTRRLMATLHPAYLLRTPAQKRMAWRDLLAVVGTLG